MNHAEEPTLPGVVDDRAGLKSSTNRGVSRFPYQRVDVVRHGLIIDQLAHGAAEAELHIVGDLVFAGSETGAAQQVLDDVLAVPYYSVPVRGIPTRVLHRLPLARIIPLVGRSEKQPPA
jgi:hypothetical protein